MSYNLVISSPRSAPDIRESSSEAATVFAAAVAATAPADGVVLDPVEAAELEEDLTLVFGNLWSFFHFILRFWNQILICRSESTKEWAISMRLRRVR